MQTHNPTYCCSQMATWIINNVIAVNPTTGTAHMNVHYTPTPGDTADPAPTIERIEVKHCPNCGDSIGVYSEAFPAPEYTRASALGGSCDDSTCRHNNTVTHVCSFQFRNIGCFNTDAAVKTAYEDLRSNVWNGFEDFTKE